MLWPSWPNLARFDHTIAGPWWNFVHLAMECFSNNDYGATARQRYLEHYEHVRNVVPKAILLEITATDGWGPLCEFLEQPVPESEYPKINDSEGFVGYHKKMWYMSAMFTARNISMACLPAIAIGTAIYFYRARVSL